MRLTPALAPALALCGLLATPLLAQTQRQAGAPTAMSEAERQDLRAETLKINGTPTFVIEGVMLRGYVPLDGMRQIVAEARKDG